MIHINIQRWSRFGELSWSWSVNHLLVINLLFRIWFGIINILSTCAYGENEKSTRSLFGRKFKVTSFGVSGNRYRKWSYRDFGDDNLILGTADVAPAPAVWVTIICVTDVLLKSILSFKNLVQRILGLVNKISVRIFSEMTSRRQARIKGSYSTNETTCVILTLRIL